VKYPVVIYTQRLSVFICCDVYQEVSVK
jgi:hypothetical protein